MPSLLIRLPENIKLPEQLGIDDGSLIIYAINDHNIAMILLNSLEAFVGHGYLDKPAPRSSSSDWSELS